MWHLQIQAWKIQIGWVRGPENNRKRTSLSIKEGASPSVTLIRVAQKCDKGTSFSVFVLLLHCTVLSFFFPISCDVSIARLFKETFRGRDKDTFSGQCIRLAHIADGNLAAAAFVSPLRHAKWGSHTAHPTHH